MKFKAPGRSKKRNKSSEKLAADKLAATEAAAAAAAAAEAGNPPVEEEPAKGDLINTFIFMRILLFTGKFVTTE